MEKQSLAIILANCFKAIAPLGWLALASACVHGQSVPEKYKFSPPAQTVIDRLESIETMPANEWQYHAGDLAHGESTDPDTTPWTSIQLPFVASKQEIWLRRWVVVPKDVKGYDLTGASIWFKLDISGKGPGPEYAYRSVYFNGIRVAEGQHLERQLLFASAKPREKVLIAIKLLATEYEKNLENAHLTIEVAQGRPNPEDLRAELLSAAELLPSILTKPDSLAAQEAILDAAARSVNIAALDGNDQSSFDASLRAAQKSLEPLRPTLQHYLVHMTGNAHIDAAWLWTSTETVDQVHFTFANALRLMSEYPDYTFAQSTAQYSEWMAEKFPNLFREIQQRVKEGRWELVGGMWVEPDLNMTDGESEVRQLLVGTHYLRNKFGVDVHVGWNPDSFGYNWQLPQIYKKSGIDYFLTSKLLWATDYTKFPYRLFWWEAPDGTRLLTYFPHEYANQFEAEQITKDLSLYAPSIYGTKLTDSPQMLYLYGIGDHGGGPTRTMLDQATRLRDPSTVFPKIDFSTAKEFFADLNQELPTLKVPTWKDELYFEYHRGVYTSQACTKQRIRRDEELMLDAEKYASLASLFGRPYAQDQFELAWKNLLFDHFHDVMPGSGIAVNYLDAKRNLEDVARSANELTHGALDEILAHVNTQGDGVPVVILNSL